MLIFDSDNNYSQNLILDFENTLIKADSLSINTVLKDFIEVNFILSDVIEIAKMEQLNNVKTVKIFPNFSNNLRYFTLKINHIVDFNIDTKNYKIFCDKNCILTDSENVIENFLDSFEEYTRFKDITSEELSVIQNYMEKQMQPRWFNDQNIFVENEYKRIKRLTKKKLNMHSDNHVFDPSVLKTDSGSLDPFNELAACIGLEKVKEEVQRLNAVLEYKKQTGALFTESMHMCFYGNPGTGKTTIARIMAGILYNLGYIKENKCVEINGLELKGANVGQTSVITKSTIDFAKGGVLFIDEAYTLFDTSENNFGIEAINLLLKEMEDNREDLVVILAGYYGPMQKLLDSNVGFRSRIKHYFDFEDYTAIQLFEIFMLSLRNKHLYLDEKAAEQILLNFENARTKKGFGNGRFVENYLAKIEEEHILNVSKNISPSDIVTSNDIIALEDFDEQ